MSLINPTKSSKRIGLLVAVIVMVAFPLIFNNPTVTTIATYCIMYMAIATAWNSFSGFSGYVSLGHAIFFGVGAYTLSLISTNLNMSGGYPVFALVPVAGIVAGAIALPIGFVALRTKRHTFVVITIAAFFIFQLLAENLGFTKGSEGVTLAPGGFAAADYNNPFYYASAIILVLTVLLVWHIKRSRFGLQLFAIRDEESRARSLGVKVDRVKLVSFALSAIPVGMIGAIWAYFIGQIYPQFAFAAAFDVTIALMCFFGGLGTLAGPIFGALVLEALQRYLVLSLTIQNLYLIIYGLLFLAVIVLMPEGVLPSVRKLITNRFLSGGSDPNSQLINSGSMANPTLQTTAADKEPVRGGKAL